MLFCGKPYSTVPEAAEAIKKLGVQLVSDKQELSIDKYPMLANEKIQSMWANANRI